MRRSAIVSALLLVPVTVVALTATPALAGARDDDATVCAATAKTVTEGLNTFVTHMQSVSEQATGGDLSGAQESVKKAGAALVHLSDELADAAAKAETPKLKDTITKLSAEFDNLGASLTDLSSLEGFNTTKLDSIAATMSEICGDDVAPSLLPSPSAT